MITVVLILFLMWCIPACGEPVVGATQSKVSLTADTVPQGSWIQEYYPEINESVLHQFQMLADAGVTWIRSDMPWGAIERTKGVYDFSKFLTVLDELEKRDIGAIFILGYNNSIYGGEYFQGPSTPEQWDAFARFAAQAAQVFKGRRVMFDIWNEPNCVGELSAGGFWRYPVPVPSKLEAARHFTMMAKRATESGHKVNPDAIFMAPSTSGIDWEYLQVCFENGLLEGIDVVAVHPYRVAMPETIITDYQRLRANIDFYSKGRYIPIISTEFGTFMTSERRQAAHLARYWLVHYLLGIPSVWYSVMDAGDDPNNLFANQGCIKLDMSPKMAYKAAKTLNTFLSGYKCWARINTEQEGDYILLFEEETNSSTKYRLAAWTTGLPHDIKLPLAGTDLHAVDLIGKEIKIIENKDETVTLPLNGDPYYLSPDISNDALKLWSCIKLSTKTTVESGATIKSLDAAEIIVTIRNVFTKEIHCMVDIKTPTGVTGEWQGSPKLSLKPSETKNLKWFGSVKSGLDGKMGIPILVQIHGMPDISASVWLHAGKSGIVVLSEGKTGESWSTSGKARIAILSPTDKPEASNAVRMDYELTENSPDAGLKFSLNKPRDLSGYEAWNFELFVPEAGLSGTLHVKLNEYNGRRFTFVVPPEWIAKHGWQRISIGFNGMWLENGVIAQTDYRDITLEAIESFGFTVVGKTGDKGSLAIRNVGVSHQMIKVPLGSNPWNL